MERNKYLYLGGIERSLSKIKFYRKSSLKYFFLQWVYCRTWPVVARAGEAHVAFTAFPLSFPCDAHIPNLSSLVRQSDLYSRPVHTWKRYNLY